MRKLFPSKSKKGVTLVEAVFAVVVLGLFATGLLNLLTAGSVKIHKSIDESSAHAQATQHLDLVIAAISNGSSTFIEKGERTDADGSKIPTCTLNPDTLKSELGLSGVTLQVKTALYDADTLYDVSAVQDLADIRGWYIKLTYMGKTVTGFASNSEGVFDN